MSNTLTCVYCGAAYPEGTPPHGSDVLTAHIRVCSKHPMRELEADYHKVRAALLGLVGSDSRDVLDEVESNIRVMRVPDEDRVNTLNAIHAIKATIGKWQSPEPGDE